jgi:hypothetical protein
MNDEFLIELYLQFVEYLYTCYGECFINRTKNMAYFLNVMKEINGASDTFKCYHFTDESLNSFIKAVYRSQPDKLREIANETSMHYLKN